MRFLDKAGLFWRSLFLQSLWSFERMQAAGFSFALDPWLRACWPTPARLRRARQRHLAFFNTQPYMASFCLGAACQMEKALSEMEEGLQSVAEAKTLQFKGVLAPALAAMGDSFFWGALRPTLALLSAAVFLIFQAAGDAHAWAWAVGGYLLLYNTAAVGMRWWGLGQGYRHGARLAASLQAMPWREGVNGLRLAGLLLAAGLLAAALADPQGLGFGASAVFALLSAGLLRFAAGPRAVYGWALAAGTAAAAAGWSLG